MVMVPQVDMEKAALFAHQVYRWRGGTRSRSDTPLEEYIKALEEAQVLVARGVGSDVSLVALKEIHRRLVAEVVFRRMGGG